MTFFPHLSDVESSLVRVMLVLGLALVIPVFFDRKSSLHRGAIFSIASVLALRYLWWRATETISPFGLTLDCLASWSLLGLEALSVVSSLSSFLILSRTKDRKEEATANKDWWLPAAPPHVAILIATYNEELEILERTIVGAKALNHPSKEVLVLDDGRRDWLRTYCAKQGVRYMRRPNNKGSKAGNINHALDELGMDARPPDFVAVLDADFVPHTGFLSRTLALFHDQNVGLVQTPQHFFNADPVQHNLGLSRSYPDEQRLFFDHLQPARDAWDIAFCCGTSSIVRWMALKQVGGFPTESITEDFMMTLVLRNMGWATVYLNEPVTEGLAPEGLKEYVTQRARWCLGMMQIARSHVGPLARNNLRLRDRWSVLDAGLYWLSTFPFRIAALVYPLFYWYFNITVVNASVADVISVFGVYYVWVLLAMNSVARGMVVPIINDVSQILAAVPISRAAIVGLVRPNGHPFKVTAKGGDRSKVIIQWRMLAPYLVLLCMTTSALFIGVFFDDFAFTDAGAGKQVILFWTLYNVVVLSVTMIAFIELPRKERHFADKPFHGTFITKRYARQVWVVGLTQDTLRIRGHVYQAKIDGHIDLPGIAKISALVVSKTADGAILRLRPTPEQRESLLLYFYAEGEAPGVSSARMSAVMRDLAMRASFRR